MPVPHRQPVQIVLHSEGKKSCDNVACVVAFHNPNQVGTKTHFDDYGGDLDLDSRKKLVEILK